MIARTIQFFAIALLLALTVPLELRPRIVIDLCIVAIWGSAYWIGLRDSDRLPPPPGALTQDVIRKENQ